MNKAEKLLDLILMSEHNSLFLLSPYGTPPYLVYSVIIIPYINLHIYYIILQNLYLTRDQISSLIWSLKILVSAFDTCNKNHTPFDSAACCFFTIR